MVKTNKNTKRGKIISFSSYPKTYDEASKHNYKYWSKQPVIGLEDRVFVNKPLNDNLVVDEEQKKLPDNYRWEDIDMTESSQRSLIADFLNKFYVDSFDCKFKTLFEEDFLKWLFVTPQYMKGLCKAVYFKDTIIAFIGCTIIDIRTGKDILHIGEPKLMCINHNFRNKSLAPKLMNEIKRVLFSYGIKFGSFTTERYVPKPFTSAQYYHRPLNVDKLIKTEFQRLDNTQSVDDIINTFKLPRNPVNGKKIRKLQEDDLELCYVMLTDHLEKYSFYRTFNEEEFKHYFWDNPFVSSYVLLDEDGDIVDMLTFHKQKLRALKSNDTVINKGVLSYFTTNVETAYRNVHDILILARSEGIDVLSALNIAENENLLLELKFGAGVTKIYYNMYNFMSRELMNKEVNYIPLV